MMTKTCNACMVNKPVDAFSSNGSGCLRPQCKDCRKVALVAWRAANPEKSRNGAKRWANENKSARRAIEARYRGANPEKSNEWSSKYRRANLGKSAAWTAERRAAKALRTPPWANLDAIESIYEQCEAQSRETGIPHHVDHEIPLRGKLVSGLHVETNLRVITATENMKKKNKFVVGAGPQSVLFGPPPRD